jgi:hypothetical protein
VTVELFWLPLGAGGRCVRLNGRAFEALSARRTHRARCDLYHSALIVDNYAIEMAPVWNERTADRGVVAEVRSATAASAAGSCSATRSAAGPTAASPT